MPAEAIPGVLGELERIKAVLLGRFLGEGPNGRGQAPQGEDRLLSVKEAAEKLSVSADYLYRRASRLPFSVRIGRHLRFSSQGIERYIRARAGK